MAGDNQEMRRNGIPLDVLILNLTYLKTKYPEAREYCWRNLMRTPWPSDTMGGSTSGGDISDPTGNTAVDDRWAEHIRQMDQCLWFLYKIEKQLNQLVRDVPVPLDHIRDEHRCNRGSGMRGATGWKRFSGWRDDNCVNFTTRGDGLCDACRQRRDHWFRETIKGYRDENNEWQFPRAQINGAA